MLPGKLALHLLSVYRSWRRGIVLLLIIRECLRYLTLCLYRLLELEEGTFTPPIPGELEFKWPRKKDVRWWSRWVSLFGKASSAAFLLSASGLVKPSQKRSGFMHHKFDDQLATFFKSVRLRCRDNCSTFEEDCVTSCAQSRSTVLDLRRIGNPFAIVTVLSNYLDDARRS